MGKRNHDTLSKRDPDPKSGLDSMTKYNIDMAEKKVLNDKKYGPQFEEIKNCLKRFPYNKIRDEVIYKILLIDFTNSTNLRFSFSRSNDFSVFKLAEQIIHWNIDKRIENGDPDVVDDIAQFGNANNFSFATKYCCYHNYHIYEKDNYSIFDKIVAKTIPQYLDVTQKRINECKDKGYQEYHKLITGLIDVYDLHFDFVRRKLDYFLWYPNRKGKEDEKHFGN